MRENVITGEIVDGAYKIHTQLGPGLLDYLRLTNKRLGLLINFNSDLIKNGITRLVNNL